MGKLREGLEGEGPQGRVEDSISINRLLLQRLDGGDTSRRSYGTRPVVRKYEAGIYRVLETMVRNGSV